ncbi:MAG TPA: response regulator, partial [Vicinamibacteria bacterium]|nr:response regulator [Vicinamibacteria bacterium]
RVLVVDDDADARDLVGTVLGGAGATVILAGSAHEARVCFEREPPHLIFSDLEMPDEDGYQLIREIRARPAEAGGLVPAVALTAYATTQDRLKALRAGFQTHLAKPVQPAEIVATAESLLRLGMLPNRGSG